MANSDIWFRKNKIGGGGTWYVNIWDPVNKVKIKEACLDRKDALVRSAKIRNEVMSRSPFRKRNGPVPTLGEYIPQFLATNYTNEQTRSRAARSLKRFMEVTGDVSLLKIGKGALHQLVVRRQTEHVPHPYKTGNRDEGKIRSWRKRNEKPIAKTTINLDIEVIKRLFSHACHAEILELNPMATYRKFHGKDIKDRQRMRYLEHAEILRLLDAAAESKNPMLLPIVFLALYLGRRRGEILKLRKQDFDRENGFAFLKNTKGGGSERVPVPPTAQKVLEKLHAEATCDWLFPNKNMTGPLLDFDTAFKIAKRNAGLSDFRFHDLRHTAISYMVMAGVDLMTIAKLVGHSNASMIEQRYGHLSPHHKQASAVIFGSVMDRLTGKSGAAAVPTAAPATGPTAWLKSLPIINQVAALIGRDDATDGVTCPV